MNTAPISDQDQVGVVIVNFNGGAFVVDCIDSVLRSGVSVDIVVADNGSSDGSLEVLQGKYDSIENVRIIPNGENLGFAAGCNTAFAALSQNCRFVLFLNPDCRIEAETLEKMLILFDQTPDVGMTGCLILNEDGSEQRGCRRNEPTPLRALSTMVSLGRHVEGVNRTGESLPAAAVEVDAISGAFMLVRREAIDAIGLMDEDYFLHCEDLDWCKRFRLSGWKILFNPLVSITHLKGGSSHGRPIRVEWHKHWGMIRYYRKFYTGKHPFYLIWAINLAVAGRFLVLLPRLMVRNLRT